MLLGGGCSPVQCCHALVCHKWWVGPVFSGNCYHYCVFFTEMTLHFQNHHAEGGQSTWGIMCSPDFCSDAADSSPACRTETRGWLLLRLTANFSPLHTGLGLAKPLHSFPGAGRALGSGEEDPLPCSRAAGTCTCSWQCPQQLSPAHSWL